MALKRIMIVEDEVLITMDLKTTLEKLGYIIAAQAASADEAFRKAGEMPLDLVLMDIRLQNGSDGVEVAERIRRAYKIPIVYLTSYTDEETLRRATQTEPFGYIVKPYRAQELRAGIEVALYKHAVESKLQEREEWFSTTLACIEDGVIASDERGRVVFMNPAAERLTGWTQEDTVNKAVEHVFNVPHNPVPMVLKEGRSYQTPTSLLVNRAGSRMVIQNTTAPIRNRKGEVKGAVIAFRHVAKSGARVDAADQIDTAKPV